MSKVLSATQSPIWVECTHKWRSGSAHDKQNLDLTPAPCSALCLTWTLTLTLTSDLLSLLFDWCWPDSVCDPVSYQTAADREQQ